MSETDTHNPEPNMPCMTEGMMEHKTTEYETAKTETVEVWGMPPNTYCMLLHLSQLLNCCLPPFGTIMPIVMWAVGKDKSVLIDRHGKIALNWTISCVIYWMVVAALCIVLIGFLLIPVLLVLTVVFPIIGAVKVNNNGEAWEYPLSIPFFK